MSNYINGTVLMQNNTHKAVRRGEFIDIFVKGFEFEDLKYEDELIDCIPAENEDDLLAIFDMFDENNRINRAEAEQEFKNYKI